MKKDLVVFSVWGAVLFTICILIVMHVYPVNKLVNASSKSPYSIGQCDQWLMNSAGAGSNQERTTLATLASACYLSQRKE
jgi:hypothetical protein